MHGPLDIDAALWSDADMNTEQICEAIRAKTQAELIALHNASGVPFPTLEAIKRGRTNDPRGKTLDAVRPFLEAEQN